MKKFVVYIMTSITAAAVAVIVAFFLTAPASIKPETLGASRYDSIRALCLSGNGYMLAGMTMSSGLGYVDAYMISLDRNGRKSWENTFGGKGDDRIFDIVNNGAGFVMAGYTSSYGAGDNDFYMVSTNEKGDMKYSRAFGTPGKDRGVLAL